MYSGLPLCDTFKVLDSLNFLQSYSSVCNRTVTPGSGQDEPVIATLFGCDTLTFDVSGWAYSEQAYLSVTLPRGRQMALH